MKVFPEPDKPYANITTALPPEKAFKVEGQGFTVEGQGFTVEGLRLRAWGLGNGVKGSGLGSLGVRV